MLTMRLHARRLNNHLIVATRLLIVALVFCFAVTPAIAQQALEAKAQTIDKADLLTEPENLAEQVPEGVSFAIAEEAPTVEFAAIPLPDKPADPWSIWGYGLIHSNGRFYVPLGDHLGIDSNSYIYEYDPETKVVREVADLLSAVEDYEEGDFGYGKIHGRLNEGADGNIYFGTYWGQWNKSPDNRRYEGDRVFRYNPETEEMTDLGMPAFGWGFPSTHMDEQRMLFYAEAHRRKTNSRGDAENNYLAPGYESTGDSYQIEFLVYDTRSRERIFQGRHEGLAYGRDFFVDDQGNAYFNNGGGSLQKYDPETNMVTPVEGVKMPADGIRRAVGPDENGVMYGSSHEGNSTLFAFDPGNEENPIRIITTVWANTPGMDVTPDGQYLYCVPGGHGPSTGVPLIQVDTQTGAQKALAFLHQPVWEQTRFNLGGTYSVHVTDDGSTVYVGFNGKKDEASEHWGDLAVVTVHIPESER